MGTINIGGERTLEITDDVESGGVFAVVKYADAGLSDDELDGPELLRLIGGLKNGYSNGHSRDPMDLHRVEGSLNRIASALELNNLVRVYTLGLFATYDDKEAIRKRIQSIVGGVLRSTNIEDMNAGS